MKTTISSQTSRMELVEISHDLTKFGKTIVKTKNVERLIDELGSTLRVKAHVIHDKTVKKNEYCLALSVDQNFHK